MPSVTRWRQPSTAFLQRPPSPARPTAIEAIDDVPLPSHYDAHVQSNNLSRGAYNVQGLGVSFDGEREYDGHLAGPARLSYRIDGEAYLARTPPAAAGSYAQPSDHAYHWNHSQSPYNSSSKRKRTQGHTRSHSAMDDLANAAIAGGSPAVPFPSRPATSYIDGHTFEDRGRPSKRVKSERLPQSTWEHQDPRPHTSHFDPAQQAEAELLLHFSTHVHKSPPAQYNHYRGSVSQRGSSLAFGNSLTNELVNSETDLEQHSTSWQQHTSKINGLHTAPLESASKENYTPSLEEEINHSTEESRQLLVASNEHPVPAGSDHGRSTPRVVEPKKPRRVKPEVQQSSCAVCERMQSVNANNDETFANNWISCNGCEKWYHSACVGFKDKREVQSVDKFICDVCQPVHGETTFVRKSSRARTAIDYAGLNQGLVKSSKETALHHYIQPIKDGTFKFEHDRFARMRPELVTAEHFEKSGGMKEPFVVPAIWNPRFGESSPYEDEDALEDVEGIAGNQAIGADGTTRPLTSDTDIICEEVIDCGQDLLDMVMPRELTVRKVADLYGPSEHVPVIDVKTQNSAKKWTLKRWADYYEAPGEKDVCNVISLEVSHSSLGRIIRRPKIVRDLDLQDSVWPAEAGNRKFVAFYCLMSVADSYTDFHIDFGGSSVYYHILKGRKTFFFIPPEDKNLKKYSDWCNSDTQNETFLGDLTGDCIRVDLHPGDTAFIPAGWIHAVWTPEDSLVIGGNFLTRLHYEAQLKVANIERDTKVPATFRYPLFQKVMWFTLLKYLEDDPLPEEVKDDFIDDPEYVFRRADPVWHEFGPLTNDKEPGDEYYNARYYSKPEIEGLVPLRDYLYRTALIASNMEVEGVTKDARGRVAGSIPKVAQLDSLSFVRTFGIWCAWKIGNVQSPEWTRSADGEIPLSAESKPVKAWPDRVPPERFSKRVASLGEQAEMARTQNGSNASPIKGTTQSSQSVDFSTPNKPRFPSVTRIPSLGPKRVACEPCRKRRIKCRHKEEGELPVTPASGSGSTRPRALSSVSNDLAMPHLSHGIELGSVPAPSQHVVPSTSLNLSGDIAQTSSNFHNRLSSPVDGSGISAGKKGRSKACEECRKSKRRCVHDENGKVDPAKSAEPTRPRGSGTAKRPARVSNDFETDSKRPRTSAKNDIDGLIDPTLTSPCLPQQAQLEPSLQEASRLIQSAADAIRHSTSEMNNAFSSVFSRPSQLLGPPVDVDVPQGFERFSSPNELNVKAEHESPVLHHASTQLSTGSLVSPPDSTGSSVDFPSATNDIPQAAMSPDGGSNTSLGLGANVITPASASRHSSRQPKTVDRFVPDGFVKSSGSRGSEESHAQKQGRRASSSAASALTVVSDVSRRLSSNTSGMVDGLTAPTNNRPKTEVRLPGERAGSTDSVAVIDDADERLARELHAQENGLRRRSTRA